MLKKSILQKMLAYEARAIIKKYKPTIIAVTGSMGKTSTRMAIFDVLKESYRVRTAEKNFNNEIGVPLTILGINHQGRNILLWVWSLARVWIALVLSTKKYPEILVLEYGVDHPGDMDYLVSIARPDIAVITAIGEVPAHIEFFADTQALGAEKAKLVQALSSDGYAILNHDDYAVYDMKEKTKAHVMTFGFEEHADIKIVHYELRAAKDEAWGDMPEGITMKIQHGGSIVPVRLHHIFEIPACYAAAAAAAVGLVLNKNMVEISSALTHYESPPGRLRLIKGIKNSLILDDTYNASPEAMRAALETLAMLPGKRKIAMLGDMLEIGTYTEQAHRSVGNRVAQCADMLITVGARAKFITDEAVARGIDSRARVLAPNQVLSFDDPIEAGKALDPLIKEGDLILVKGSQGMRMEKAVYEIMGQPLLAKKLLVRQEEYWKRNKEKNAMQRNWFYGFTLIELLVVISIIALLSSVVFASINTSRSRARDSRRLADIKQIQTALELYYDSNKLYPPINGACGWPNPGATWCTNANQWAALQTELLPYLPRLPGDPLGPDDFWVYFYDADSGDNFQTYGLGTKLENPGNFSLIANDNGWYNITTPGPLFGCCFEVGQQPSYCTSTGRSWWYPDATTVCDGGN